MSSAVVVIGTLRVNKARIAGRDVVLPNICKSDPRINVGSTSERWTNAYLALFRWNDFTNEPFGRHQRLFHIPE